VNFGDLGDRHPCVDHLLDTARPLDVGELPALVVLNDLLSNTFDQLGRFVACGDGPDIHRNGSESGFARGEGSALACARAELSILAADGGDRGYHTVLLDAGYELGVEVGLVANVGVQDERVRVEVFQRADRLAGAVVGNLGGGGGVGHDEPF
jgi:hypothetical protein